jgi:hypothetical protein
MNDFRCVLLLCRGEVLKKGPLSIKTVFSVFCCFMSKNGCLCTSQCLKIFYFFLKPYIKSEHFGLFLIEVNYAKNLILMNFLVKILRGPFFQKNKKKPLNRTRLSGFFFVPTSSKFKT